MGWRTRLGALVLLSTLSAAHAQTLGRPVTTGGPSLPQASPPALLPAAPLAESTGEPAFPAGVVVSASGADRVEGFADLPAVPVPPAVTPVPQVPAPPSEGQLPSPAPAKEEKSGSGPGKDSAGVKFKFSPGDDHLLQMEYANGLFKFFVGGRLQIDAVWLRAADNVMAPVADGGIGRADDATNFRRARFDFGGTFYRNIDFLMEFDFINTTNAERVGAPLPVDTPVPTDLWVTFKEIPVLGNVRVGNQKPPISFEHLTSSRFLNFLERSLAFDAFIENQNNGFEFGVSAFDTFLDQRGTWAVGVFKNTRSIFGWNVGDGEYDVTGRVTCLPVYANDGEVLVHLGVGASHRDLDDDVDRMRARLLVRNGPAILHNIVAEVITGGTSRDQVVPELVVVYGPWTFAAEYYRVWVHQATVPPTGPRAVNYGTAQFDGAYAELLYFLTGEHREYNRKTGAFWRVTPRRNYRGFGTGEPEGDCEEGEEECGIGAWQVGVRYSWLDMNDRGIRGGATHDVTLGLNWFLNPYMKWQWNYTALYREAPNPDYSGWVYAFGTRLAFDF